MMRHAAQSKDKPLRCLHGLVVVQFQSRVHQKYTHTLKHSTNLSLKFTLAVATAAPNGDKQDEKEEEETGDVDGGGICFHSISLLINIEQHNKKYKSRHKHAQTIEAQSDRRRTHLKNKSFIFASCTRTRDGTLRHFVANL